MAPMFRPLDHDFFKSWSPTMAYVLGFFVADGSMIKNKRGAHFIEFHSTDKILILNVRRAVGSGHKVGVRHKKGNRRVAYVLQLGSREMFCDLSDLRLVQNKSNVVRLPEIPREYISAFVRGYFDGDGNVYFRKHKTNDRPKKRWIFSTRFTSGSRKYLADLHSALHEEGLAGGFILNKRRGYELVFSHHDSLALYKLMYHTVPAAELYLPRKQRLFKRAIKTLYSMRV